MAKIKGKIKKAKEFVEQPQEEAVETPIVEPQVKEAPVVEEAKAEEPQAEEVKTEETPKVRCPDCPWKAGLKDANTLCPTCKGHGVV